MIGDGSDLFADRPVADGRCARLRVAGMADPRSGTLTFTAQLLEARADDRKIVGRSWARALTPQLFDASSDHRKIVSRARLGHSFLHF
jgi:hypothetical protein